MKKNLILIDEAIESDHRVLATIKGYDQPIIFDCTKITLPKLKRLSNLSIAIQTFISLPIYCFKLNASYNIKPNGIVKGLMTSIVAYSRSKKVASFLRKKYKKGMLKSIHANDFMCGMIGAQLAVYFNIDLIYDAHEVEFHRNRKNSLLRVVFDMLLEQKVINVAKKIIVVNRPIKMLYMDIYNIPESKINIIDNNHFAPHMGFANSMFNENINEMAIVYVGGGTNGRKLESLGFDCSQTDVKVHAFFLSRTPDIAYEHDWILGSTDYLLELLELIKKKRSIMWCCTDDICLSYRLSLPNKFFQAMAVGIPVIAYKGTYLAEIVRENNLGFTYDDHNFREITDQLKDSKKYYALLESVSVFQEKLFLEKLEL